MKVDHEIESYNFFTKVWDPPSKPDEIHEKLTESSGKCLNLFSFYLFTVFILVHQVIVLNQGNNYTNILKHPVKIW